jgi:threonine dehydrogenase-like Zn-dependent dehydrogenase
MRALVFGVPPEPFEVPDDANILTHNLAHSPVSLRDVADPQPLHDDWVITRPRLTGICGSDSKQILLDFGEGDTDNAMAAFCSFPQVMGHEVVADVVALGPAARGLEVGQRVVLNPWLSCGPRGIEPPCPACEAGDYSLCWSFTDGDIQPGIHTGVSADVTGGYAELMPAHDSMLFAVPDSVPDEVAMFADPFSVSLHAITRHPPPPSCRVLVYGAGSLGLCALAVLRVLYPQVAVAVVARFDAQAELARRFGADKVLAHEPRLAMFQNAAGADDRYRGSVRIGPVLIDRHAVAVTD